MLDLQNQWWKQEPFSEARMVRLVLVLACGLAAAGMSAEAAAQQAPLFGAKIGANPARNVPPPPPASGACTQNVPCRGILGETFFYTRSGDRRYVSRR
ncbi:hypothetical protein EXY23_01675 [Roseicella aquatilis]|uniref:Uncharacterized protein n=1 Tax=Roseicella aquatilis TaxID=2527868 RepID=A0A4V2WM79_9PROT|nr:hypothetical protein EXY23_01675 [Roseicella aquatilis]